MKIQDLLNVYAQSPQVGALAETLRKKSVKNIFLEGLMCSSAPMLFASLSARQSSRTARQSLLTTAFVLQDADEAGYFYHDLVQLLGEGGVSFFPSSYRRAVKYGQRDAASEILRTQVLSQLASHSSSLTSHLYIVTYPEALAEQVVSKKQLDDHMLVLRQGDVVDVEKTLEVLRQMGLHEVDYVYEPGQFALRGSILDVYSYSSELPFRIDFFGDDIDSIRTFEVDTQLSKDKREQVEIVPELAVVEEKVSLLSFLPSDAVLVVKDFLYVHDAIGRTYDEGFSAQALKERMEEATEVEQQTILEEMNKEAQLMTASQFMHEASAFRRIEVGTHATGVPDATITFHTSPQPQFHKNFDLLQQSLEQSLAGGYRLCILADSPKQLERLRDIFAEKGSVSFDPVERTLHAGFVDHDLKLCVFTDHQIFDRFHKYNLRSDKARGGKVALTLKEIQTGYQEMIKIQYDGGGTIYVSIHSLYKVSKYKAQDGGEPPRLSHLGTGQWERMKERTKQKLKDIARDLIQLYAARRQQRGFAFSADSFMQHELEASFLYEDTPDQLKATNDVKADMERPQPMDRLVCGDVGFGKTEVAVRAAFKAACDSKQVAVLVPTTVILKDLADGKIDILIGTHKLIGKSVKFKDLGLLIIDEEQKFGVSTKEKLRQMKTNVDTLTMSATPIPRTLQFSLVGARDLSIIQTPPPNRYPIQTEIHTFGAEIIADAVNFEMSRNGQVYFVNPRINDLQRMRDLIHKYVPDARIAVGHGQMKPEELEKIIFDFQNYDYDVLLSTTIVENGIDIPNANTIIINGAHHFGLSDLHQMRGRVGRGNRKAFCYLLAPPLAALPVESRRRLEALEQFSDLGSGIHIAMQDYETYVKILNQAVVELRNERDERLEMTGERCETSQGKRTGAAGSRVSHGYQDGPSAQTPTLSPHFSYVSDCSLDSDLELYFPDQYVPSDSERMLLYRELDGLQTDEQLAAYRTRLVDRFGAVPACGEELMRVVPLRRLGKELGCEKIMLKQGRMTLYFVSRNDSPYYQSEVFDRILSYVAQNPRRCQFREQNGKRSMLIAAVPTIQEAVQLLKQIHTVGNHSN